MRGGGEAPKPLRSGSALDAGRRFRMLTAPGGTAAGSRKYRRDAHLRRDEVDVEERRAR